MKDQPSIEWVSVEELHLNASNPRQNEKAVGPVKDSLARFGWKQPVVADKSGRVWAGNTRLKAAKELGMEKVPVWRIEGTELEMHAFAIADNRTSEFADWDNEMLSVLLGQLQEEDMLDGVGYTDAEVFDLIDRFGADETPGPEPEPESPRLEEPAISAVGDTWLLGEHRVHCGDSCEQAAHTAALAGRSADMVWTDPPYGVDYVGKTKDSLTIENDGKEGLLPLLSGALGAAFAACRPGAVWYVAAPAGPQFLPFAQVLTELEVWRQTLVWVKDVFVLGHSDFHYRHEVVFYGWKPGKSHVSAEDRTHDTVWEIARPKRSEEHPTMKPIELVEKAIRLSSTRGDTVLDPFGGSGTTLLAAERTGRKAALIELSPHYVDVIVRRWEEATGLEATLEETGETFTARSLTTETTA